jgi:hypothetical protein
MNNFVRTPGSWAACRVFFAAVKNDLLCQQIKSALTLPIIHMRGDMKNKTSGLQRFLIFNKTLVCSGLFSAFFQICAAYRVLHDW